MECKGLFIMPGWKLTFLISLLDLNVCWRKESLSMTSISLTLFTCSTRMAWSSSFLLLASSFLSLGFNNWKHGKRSYLVLDYEWVHVCVLSRVWLCDPMDCNPLGSSVHETFQARTVKSVVISYSRGSSWPRDPTRLSCTGRWILYHHATWEVHVTVFIHNNIHQDCAYLWGGRKKREK